MLFCQHVAAECFLSYAIISTATSLRINFVNLQQMLNFKYFFNILNAAVVIFITFSRFASLTGGDQYQQPAILTAAMSCFQQRL